MSEFQRGLGIQVYESQNVSGQVLHIVKMANGMFGV